MSANDPNISTKAFWRAKYARQCTKRFQFEQLRPYIFDKPSVPPPSIPGEPPSEPPKPSPPILVDRPPLHPIAHPIPILEPKPESGPEPTPAPAVRVPAAAQAAAQPEGGVGVARVLGQEPTPAPPLRVVETSDITVGIIGAGASGLYIAMILQSLGIDYEILEGSDRPGGRILTHHFKQGKAPWNYFDIGAMRYPKIQIMWRVFNLFEERLGLGDKLVPYIMSNDNQFLDYNRQRVQQKVADGEPHSADIFKDSVENNGLVPESYIKEGVGRWLEQCFKPFKDLLAQDWDKGWKKLMLYDGYSARSFMATEFHDKNEDGSIFLEKEAYPDPVINWMERMNTGTGLFDMAFAEMVIDDLQFDWPNASSVKYGATPVDGEGPSWYCLAGGSEIFIKAMVSKLKKTIQYKKRVTHIVPTGEDKPMQVTYSDGKAKGKADFNYVISTIPLPSLRFVDLDMCNLSYAQLEGMRTLRYDSSCKVGIRFKSRWWQNLGSGSIKGGQSKTDRIIRTAVFPSYGVDDPEADAVMIASYTWSQDASRVGGLMRGRESEAEEFLIENILEDLSLLHGVELKFLVNELDDWCAFDWYADPYTLGAFALFGPGQFNNIYPAFGQGAAGGRLLFAGEALSAQHAWVEGALDSAYVTVQRLLDGAGLDEKVKELERLWGNPHLREEERKESKEIMWLQEIIGAVLSIMDDYDLIKGTLKDLEIESMFDKFLSEVSAITAAA